MSPRSSAPCSHELRPGTTVCLYCRREARQAARQRAGRVALRIGGMAAGLAALVALGIAGAGALHGRQHSPLRLTESAIGGVRSPLSIDSASALSALPDAPPTAGGSARAAAPLIAEGRTDLGDGLFAVRDGNSVTVHFDTPETRTRRRDKFEHIVRTTLPRVFGALADSVLDHLPSGEVVPPPEMPADLTGRGIRLALPDGRAITLWPETRPGRDGPLVVSYRASIAG